MSPSHLTAEERQLLLDALNGPLTTREPEAASLCMKLCALKLLQRAGGIAAANGWRGSPNAYFLTRDGWAMVKSERRAGPVRRAV
ncbi:hypothetical protein [Phenylobacterium zucineum]|uniref:hypothetical protein n=1 Tax=Phenylobacterium zucineum TaxID=284016 RepID=UPI00059CFB79|nr:hypothetical protein [Phenylobacterium zucineum]